MVKVLGGAYGHERERGGGLGGSIRTGETGSRDMGDTGAFFPRESQPTKTSDAANGAICGHGVPTNVATGKESTQGAMPIFQVWGGTEQVARWEIYKKEEWGGWGVPEAEAFMYARFWKLVVKEVKAGTGNTVSFCRYWAGIYL